MTVTTETGLHTAIARPSPKTVGIRDCTATPSGSAAVPTSSEVGDASSGPGRDADVECVEPVSPSSQGARDSPPSDDHATPARIYLPLRTPTSVGEEESDDPDGSSRRIRADDRYGAGEGRRARDLRDHGRPREGDDLPVALPARGAWAARLPDRRRGGRRLDRERPSRAGEYVDRGNRREDRPGGVRPLRG